jgi:hypothetical protein
VAGSAFSEMLWDKTMLGYWNDTVKSSKKKVLVWETRFEPGTSREGSKYTNCPSAAFHVFASIYSFTSSSLYDAFSTTYVTQRRMVGKFLWMN